MSDLTQKVQNTIFGNFSSNSQRLNESANFSVGSSGKVARKKNRKVMKRRKSMRENRGNMDMFDRELLQIMEASGVGTDDPDMDLGLDPNVSRGGEDRFSDDDTDFEDEGDEDFEDEGDGDFEEDDDFEDEDSDLGSAQDILEKIYYMLKDHIEGEETEDGEDYDDDEMVRESMDRVLKNTGEELTEHDYAETDYVIIKGGKAYKVASCSCDGHPEELKGKKAINLDDLGNAETGYVNVKHLF